MTVTGSTKSFLICTLGSTKEAVAVYFIISVTEHAMFSGKLETLGHGNNISSRSQVLLCIDYATTCNTCIPPTQVVVREDPLSLEIRGRGLRDCMHPSSF